MYPDSPQIQKYSDPVRKHRKDWEFAISLSAMEKYGLLNRSGNALGVGSGHERILYFLTKYINHVTATDLYGETDFSNDEAKPDVLENMDLYAPFSYEKDRLEFQSMNGTELKFNDNSFDIVFSYSSIEHFGGIDMAVKSINEMGRVVRPGGLVTIVSEYITDYSKEQEHPEFFNKSEITNRFIEIKSLKPVEPFDFKCDKDKVYPFKSSIFRKLYYKIAHLINFYPEYPYTRVNHKNCTWTSFHLAYIKQA